jgi:spermidine/putrescine-binding protein
VNHIGMSGNAETFAKLKLAGATQYDLFEADGLWPVRYHQEGLIEPIQLDSIPNVAKHLHPEFKRIPGLEIGGAMLMVPWGWAPTTLVYNKSKVKTPPTSYEALLDKQYRGHVAFSDQHEFLWPVAAFLLGYEPFRMDKAQLQKARDVLIQMKRNAPTIAKGWNELLRLYVEETVWIGLSNPGRALTVQAAGGPAMGWTFPKEGYVGWIDGDMLVKGAPNREAALAWLDHLHSPEYVAMNFKRLQRGSANRGGVDLLKKEGQSEMVKANLMDRPDVALKMRLIEAPPNQDEYAAAWNEVLAAS